MLHYLEKTKVLAITDASDIKNIDNIGQSWKR